MNKANIKRMYEPGSLYLYGWSYINYLSGRSIILYMSMSCVIEVFNIHLGQFSFHMMLGA
jgi:hypothetical protein